MSSVSVAPMVRENWQRAQTIYPIYLDLGQRFSLDLKPCTDLQAAASAPTPEIMSRVERWFRDADNRIEVHHVRELLVQINVEEGVLLALTSRFIGKEPKSEADRDKIDFLLVQYLAQSLPPDLAGKDLTLEQTAEVLSPLLRVAGAPKALPALEDCWRELQNCHDLHDMLDARILERARELKTSAQERTFDPGLLASFARFSFLLRRASIRLLHNDLDCIEQDLRELEKKGIREVDCTEAGYSERESLPQLRTLSHGWRQHFKGKYSQNQWFRDVVGLRNCLEKVLQPAPAPVEAAPAIVEAHAKAPTPAAAPEKAHPAPAAHSQAKAAAPAAPKVTPTTPAKATAPQAPANPPAAAAPPEVSAPAAASAPADPTAQVAVYIQAITEELKATKAGRQSIATTVKAAGQRVMLSAEEVEAYRHPAGDISHVVQRAVAARALLSAVLENHLALDRQQAVKWAQAELDILKSQSEEAEKKKATETVVTLAACSRALQKVLERASK